MTLNLISGLSARKSLMDTLHILSIHDAAVSATPFNLMYGPLYPEPRNWIRWFCDTMEYELDTKQEEKKWQAHIDRIQQADHIVLWLNRRYACDYCPFLYHLSLAPSSAELEIIDVTSFDFSRKKKIDDGTPGGLPLGHLDNEELAMALHHKRVITSSERREFLRIWDDLCRDGTNLRVADQTGLRSVREDYFDDRFFEYVSPAQFCRPAYVIGHVIGNEIPNEAIDDLFCHWRLKRLVRSGAMIAKGEMRDMRSYEVKISNGSGRA